MLNLAIAFILLALGMYTGFRVIDSIIARFNLFSNQDKVTNSDSSGICFPSDYNLGIHHTTQVASNCDLEAVCTQVAENTDSIAEGVSAVVETTVDVVVSTIEGL